MKLIKVRHLSDHKFVYTDLRTSNDIQYHLKSDNLLSYLHALNIDLKKVVT